MSRDLQEIVLKGVVSYSFKHPKDKSSLSYLYSDIVYSCDDTGFRLVRSINDKEKKTKSENNQENYNN
jgi:hypothetical protein